MCEANVFLRNKQGEEELFFELVDKIRPEAGKLVLEDIFGQRKILTAQIKEMSLASHRIVLELGETNDAQTAPPQ